MNRYSALTDRKILDLRWATEHARMAAHHAHDNYRRLAAVKKLREIDKEIGRRRKINGENRRRNP